MTRAAIADTPLFEELPVSPPAAAPLGAPKAWHAVVVDRAKSQCECTGQCGVSHKQTAGRCKQVHGGRNKKKDVRLILWPRKVLTSLAKAVALPDAELMAWCPECLKRAEDIARGPAGGQR